MLNFKGRYGSIMGNTVHSVQMDNMVHGSQCSNGQYGSIGQYGMVQYYCPSRRLKILYVVVTRTLICD